VFRFLDNNDTGARFLSRYGHDRTRVAAAMLLTLPGIPCLYTGEEVGAAYEPYKDAQPIAWNDAGELRSWYKRLIALRSQYPALRSRDIRLLGLAQDENVLAYVRPGAKPSDSILVILNYGAQPATVALGDALDPMPRTKFVDLLSGGEVRPAKSGIEVAAWSALVLKPG
jgi:glycosidase